ncbi:unnamed protein product [Triticum turgidum subsp. durum]|uniref:Uncharacterized protein n=1 Tax=Triticum turgidum subsp. durum TaxID=4567 RepID=A0A9R1BHV2_TRITD|nr:unnamed protein product [Triticum turgidum subsp. durum]
MASAGLALRAAAVAAMVAMLVLPSSGRCPSLGPAPPPPSPPAQAPPPPEPIPPVPAPAPAPRVSCGDCYSVGSQACYSLCIAPLSEICGCLSVQGRCDKCKTDMCTANCTDGGCDCSGAAADKACADTCSYNDCSWCVRGHQQGCLTTCRSECMSKCNGP